MQAVQAQGCSGPAGGGPTRRRPAGLCWLQHPVHARKGVWRTSAATSPTAGPCQPGGCDGAPAFVGHPSRAPQEEDGQEGSDGPGFWVPEEVLQEYEMADAEGPEGATADEGAEQGGDADGDGEEEATEQAGGKTGKVASAKQRQEKQPRAKGRSKGGKPAAADGDKPAAGGNGKQRQKAAGGNGKQRQQGKQQKPQAGQDKGAANGSAGGSGKGKAPKAKRARTS